VECDYVGDQGARGGGGAKGGAREALPGADRRVQNPACARGSAMRLIYEFGIPFRSCLAPGSPLPLGVVYRTHSAPCLRPFFLCFCEIYVYVVCGMWNDACGAM